MKNSEKNINIMFQYLDPTKGGIENTAYYLFVELKKKYNVCGASMTVDPDLRLKNVEYFSSKYKGWRYFLMRNFWQYKKSKKGDTTVNLCMTWFNAIGAYFAKKRYGTPYICLVHGDDIIFNCTNEHFLKKVGKKVKRLMAPRVLQLADALCINSRNTSKLLHVIASNKNEIIIHPGIHFEDLHTSWKEKEEFIILSLGRHVERKGFQFVIKALPELVKRIPNLKYILAGEGPLTREYMRLAEQLGVSKYIEFVGKVGEAEKYNLYQTCDVFIMPSINVGQSVEGFGMVFVEANMAGRYAVGTLSGGIPDAIIEGVTGHLLKDVTEETICEDLYHIYLNLNSLYTEELIKLRVDWAKKHSYCNIAKQYEKVMFEYNETLSFWE